MKNICIFNIKMKYVGVPALRISLKIYIFTGIKKLMYIHINKPMHMHIARPLCRSRVVHPTHPAFIFTLSFDLQLPPMLHFSTK